MQSAQDYRKACSACAKRKDGKERNQTFPSADSLWAHISTAHSLWIPYECVLCPMMFLPTEGLLQHHYERTHPESVPKAIYTYVAKKKEEIEQIFLESQKPLDTNRSDEKRSYVRPNLKAEPALVQCSKGAGMDQIDNFPKEKESDKSKCISDTEEVRETEESPPSSIYDPEEEEEIALEIEKEENELNQQINGTNKETVADSEVTFEQREEEILESYEPNSSLEGEDEICSAEDQDEETKGSSQNILKQSTNDNLLFNAKWCNLCSVTLKPTIRKPNHIWSKHMGVSKRFHCKACEHKTSYKHGMKAHRRIMHKMQSEVGWIDHGAALRPLYLKQYKLAFGSTKGKLRLPSENHIWKPARRIQSSRCCECQLCGQAVDEPQRNVHLWKYHIRRKRFKCRSCDYGTSHNLHQMKNHLQSSGHGDADDQSCWTDNTQALRGELEQIHRAAFGRNGIFKIRNSNND